MGLVKCFSMVIDALVINNTIILFLFRSICNTWNGLFQSMLEDLTKEEKRQKTRELKKGLDTDIYIITMVENMIVYIYFEVIRQFFN